MWSVIRKQIKETFKVAEIQQRCHLSPNRIVHLYESFRWGWNVTQPSARHPALGLVDWLSWKTSGSPLINSSGFMEACSKLCLLQIEWGVDLRKNTKPVNGSCFVNQTGYSNMASLSFHFWAKLLRQALYDRKLLESRCDLGTKACRKSD